MRLRRNEYCPIHKSISCCGREQTPYARRLQPGIRRIDDPHHPRGYRELRSPAEMRKLLNRKIVEQDKKCAICHEEFTDYSDVVPDHRNPKGMGGALVGGDERVREAHRESVRVALDQLEHYTQARIGGNHPPETTGKFIAAKFEHDTARPVDGYVAPQ